MATKKQKREAALAKREQFLAELRADGLRAQQEDRERQQALSETLAEEAREYNRHLNRVLAAALLKQEHH